MDVLYEESAVNARAAKESKKYKVLNILAWVALVIALLGLMIFLTYCLPYFIASISSTPDGYSAEDWQQQISTGRGMGIFVAMQVVFFALLWWFFFVLKKRVNVSYDYTFVSGELRIAKVFNINKRKFICKIQPEEILQLGDVEQDSYDRLAADPTIKKTIFTPNGEPAEGKFFMYMLVSANGRKLYVLECREELLVNILRFVKRGTLASDYVSQEKKKAQA
jgi:hypothetical protein